MLPCICRTGAFIALLCLAACAPLDPVLLDDDFSAYPRGAEPYPVWDVRSGDWEVTADGLLGTDCRGNWIAEGATAGNKAWRDYRLSLKFRVVSRGSDWRDGAWIAVRHTDSRSAYTLAFYSRLTALHKASRGRVTGEDSPLAQSPYVLKDDEWHALQITVVGRRIAIELDGKPLLDAEDTEKVERGVLTQSREDAKEERGWNDSPSLATGGVVLAARKWEGSEGTTQVLYKDVRIEAIGRVTRAMKRTPKYAPVQKPRLLEFMAERRMRRYTRVPRKVLAFYYTWYGTPARHGQWVHWADVQPDKHDIATSTHYPALGAYDSHDPDVIDGHIALAKSHGVDCFISTWWGPGGFDDRAFRLLLDRAKRQRFEVSAYWETVPGKGQAKIDRGVNDLVYLLNEYGDHPAFLKVDGKPVIFVYGRVMGEVDLTEWPAIIVEARRRSGKDFLLIADGYREPYARVFDGLHAYNICGWVRDKKPDELARLSQASFAEAVRIAKQQGRLSCITIIPGYDDTKIRTPGINAQRQDGETYRVLWEQAIAADPDWLVITSWNEWHEGSEIEPSYEDGDRYIKMTGQWAARFKQTRYSRVPVPEASTLISPDSAAKLRELYKGKTIGLLPDFGGEAVFWLAESGVALHELTWDEVLDPAVFNAEKLPIVVYASGESYAQTIKEQGDGDAAILRYLRQGGLLVSLTDQPFPFYYNEKREPVVSAGKFGIPIVGSGAHGRADLPEGIMLKGWEEPPANAKLTFQFDTKTLAGLPATVPFPSTGDLRWRPAASPKLTQGDTYQALARLVDEKGRHYGDGIAYTRFAASEPKDVQAIYVWMRMPDIVGADQLLFHLFRFAATKVAKRTLPQRPNLREDGRSAP